MSVKSSARVKQKRRIGEGWVSYNRVLVGNMSSKKNVGRNPNFDTDETKLLIQLWGDPKVQRTLITTHKKHSVICQLAAQMQEYGYYRSPEEITTRIKNLKCFYNRLKKEMDSGQPQSDPSWRHFNEMDAIMTRPIFSVRPNEVPQPSLKYQLEQRKQEREERRKKILEEGGTVSEHEDDDNDDAMDANKSNISEIDDGIIPDVEVDMDINDETFAALTAVEAAPTISLEKKRKLVNGDLESDADDDEDDENTLQIKEEEEGEETEGNGNNADDDDDAGDIGDTKETPKKSELTTAIVAPSSAVSNEKSIITNGALIVPKEEPIDVDADDDDGDSNDKNNSTNVGALMPTLAEMLKMTIPNSSQGSTTVTTTISNMIATKTNAASITATTSTATTAAATATVIATQPAQGKISLVPTNFLLQPKPPTTPAPTTQIQLLPNVISSQAQMPQRIILSQATAGGTSNTNPTPTGIVTTGPGGMKVLLVNAEQAGTAATLTANSLQQQLTANCMSKALGAVVANSCKLQQSQQQQTHQQQFQQMVQKQVQQDQVRNHYQLQQPPSNDDLSKRKQKKKQKLQSSLQAIASAKTKEEEITNRKDAANMRLLIRQLLAAQEKNNDIQRERLAVERERLEFEKSAVDRLLTALPNVFSAQQTMQQQPHHLHLQAQQGVVSAPTTMLFNPSKLIFTSAGGAAFHSVPTATAINGGTTVFAPSNFTATTALPSAPSHQAQINEFQLLTPKLEREE